jgi:hypothetical protein
MTTTTRTRPAVLMRLRLGGWDEPLPPFSTLGPRALMGHAMTLAWAKAYFADQPEDGPSQDALVEVRDGGPDDEEAGAKTAWVVVGRFALADLAGGYSEERFERLFATANSAWEEARGRAARRGELSP